MTWSTRVDGKNNIVETTSTSNRSWCSGASFKKQKEEWVIILEKRHGKGGQGNATSDIQFDDQTVMFGLLAVSQRVWLKGSFIICQN